MNNVEFRERLKAKRLFARGVAAENPRLRLVEQARHSLKLFGRLGQFRQGAESAGKPLPLLNTSKACLEATAAAGHADLDYSAVIQLLR